MPMKNGDLDSKGLLASIIQTQGTIKSFEVCFLLFTGKRTNNGELNRCIQYDEEHDLHDNYFIRKQHPTKYK